jgi:hypothetical protein
MLKKSNTSFSHFPPISRLRVDQQSCPSGVMAIKEQDLSIDIKFEEFCEKRIELISLWNQRDLASHGQGSDLDSSETKAFQTLPFGISR